MMNDEKMELRQVGETVRSDRTPFEEHPDGCWHMSLNAVESISPNGYPLQVQNLAREEFSDLDVALASVRLFFEKTCAEGGGKFLDYRDSFQASGGHMLVWPGYMAGVYWRENTMNDEKKPRGPEVMKMTLRELMDKVPDLGTFPVEAHLCDGVWKFSFRLEVLVPSGSSRSV